MPLLAGSIYVTCTNSLTFNKQGEIPKHLVLVKVKQTYVPMQIQEFMLGFSVCWEEHKPDHLMLTSTLSTAQSSKVNRQNLLPSDHCLGSSSFICLLEYATYNQRVSTL